MHAQWLTVGAETRPRRAWIVAAAMLAVSSALAGSFCVRASAERIRPPDWGLSFLAPPPSILASGMRQPASDEPPTWFAWEIDGIGTRTGRPVSGTLYVQRVEVNNTRNHDEAMTEAVRQRLGPVAAGLLHLTQRTERPIADRESFERQYLGVPVVVVRTCFIDDHHACVFLLRTRQETAEATYQEYAALLDTVRFEP